MLFECLLLVRARWPSLAIPIDLFKYLSLSYGFIKTCFFLNVIWLTFSFIHSVILLLAAVIQIWTYQTKIRTINIFITSSVGYFNVSQQILWPWILPLCNLSCIPLHGIIYFKCSLYWVTKNLCLPKQCLLKVKNLPYPQEPSSVTKAIRLPDKRACLGSCSAVSTPDTSYILLSKRWRSTFFNFRQNNIQESGFFGPSFLRFHPW